MIAKLYYVACYKRGAPTHLEAGPFVGVELARERQTELNRGYMGIRFYVVSHEQKFTLEEECP